jgi:hypothetical protein
MPATIFGMAASSTRLNVLFELIRVLLSVVFLVSGGHSPE